MPTMHGGGEAAAAGGPHPEPHSPPEHALPHPRHPPHLSTALQLETWGLFRDIQGYFRQFGFLDYSTHASFSQDVIQHSLPPP